MHIGEQVSNQFPAGELKLKSKQTFFPLSASAPPSPAFPLGVTSNSVVHSCSSGDAKPASVSTETTYVPYYGNKFKEFPDLSDEDAKKVDVPGDGNCFFYVLAHYLGPDKEGRRTHTEFREAVIDYLDATQEAYSWVFEEENWFYEVCKGDRKTYLEKSRIPCRSATDPQWADELMLYSAANCLGIVIMCWQKKTSGDGYVLFSKFRPASSDG